MKGIRAIGTIVVTAAALLLAGCPAKVVPDREAPRRTYLSATPEELIGRLAERNEAIAAVQARGTIEYRFDYGKRDYRGTDVRMLFGKPGSVYVRGSARVVGTLFTLKSDGERFWAELPRDKQVYTGLVRATPSLEDKEQLWEGLNPAVLAEALLLDDLKDYEVVCATFPDRYIIDLLQEAESGNLTLRRRVEFERERLRVTRHLVFGESGEVITDAYLYSYEPVGGVELPRLYVIRRHWEELSLRLEFEEILLNPETREDLFRYQPPAGFEVIDLDERKKVAEPSKS